MTIFILVATFKSQTVEHNGTPVECPEQVVEVASNAFDARIQLKRWFQDIFIISRDRTEREDHLFLELEAGQILRYNVKGYEKEL